MIWAKEECLPRDEMEDLQFTRLKETLHRIYEKVPAYRNKMDAAKINRDDIKSLKDITKLPYTVKQDLRDTYPFGMFTVPKKDLIRIHASSGTTGKPTVVGYTRKDMDLWTELVSRIAVMGGATSDDVAQISFGYGMFTGALGLHYGLENIGASVIPASAGNTDKQLMYMRDFGATLLVATPSYALHIGEVAKQKGIDPAKDLNIRIGLFGGEGMTEPMRDEMHKLWGNQMMVTQNYGMSELIGPGAAGECLELQGMHINEDHFIAEIIDPDTGEVLPAGEKGELVVSCISKEALPLIRYRTGDISRLMYEPCPCGRTTVRMENISGRSDDMLIIRGVNVFPSQIEEILLKVAGIGPHYEIIVNRKGHLDIMEIKVELADPSLLDSYVKLKELEEGIRRKIKSTLGVDCKLKLMPPKSLKRFEGKARRVTDLRK